MNLLPWANLPIVALILILRLSEARQVFEDEPILKKRLLGIFRCNGWGPGCSRIKHNSPADGETAELTESNSDGLIMPNALRAGKELFDTNEEADEESGRGNKKVPIYTLTSGLSWGPSGKRSLPFMPYRAKQAWFSNTLDNKWLVEQNQSKRKIKNLRNAILNYMDALN